MAKKVKVDPSNNIPRKDFTPSYKYIEAFERGEEVEPVFLWCERRFKVHYEKLLKEEEERKIRDHYLFMKSNYANCYE